MLRLKGKPIQRSLSLSYSVITLDEIEKLLHLKVIYTFLTPLKINDHIHQHSTISRDLKIFYTEHELLNSDCTEEQLDAFGERKGEICTAEMMQSYPRLA